jgi:hypothetical protein
MITGMTKHFMFHIRWIYILKFLYFNFFSDSFCIIFLSDYIATSISKKILSIMFYYYYYSYYLILYRKLSISYWLHDD